MNQEPSPTPEQGARTGIASCLSCAGSLTLFLPAFYSAAFLGAVGLVFLFFAFVLVVFAIAQLFTK